MMDEKGVNVALVLVAFQQYLLVKIPIEKG